MRFITLFLTSLVFYTGFRYFLGDSFFAGWMAFAALGIVTDAITLMNQEPINEDPKTK